MNSVVEIIWKDVEDIPDVENMEDIEELEALTEEVMQTCFEVEKINPTSFYVCVTLTNPEEIQAYNKQYRGIDKPTDVLSFPIFEREELDYLIAKDMQKKPKTEEGILQEVLGDIIISIPQVEAQAEEYGHSFEREFAYMLVHGFYHLRGYDHIEKEDKKIMREKEERVLAKLNITR